MIYHYKETRDNQTSTGTLKADTLGHALSTLFPDTWFYQLSDTGIRPARYEDFEGTMEITLTEI